MFVFLHFVRKYCNHKCITSKEVDLPRKHFISTSNNVNVVPPQQLAAPWRVHVVDGRKLKVGLPEWGINDRNFKSFVQIGELMFPRICSTE
jgi:hypothetical protein